MTVLALDCAGMTGYAVSPGKISGVKKISPSKNQHPGVRYRYLWNLLVDLYRQYPDIDLVVYEEPIPHHEGMLAAEFAWGYVATIKMWAAIQQIPVRGIHISSWKKHVTGKGNAVKQEIIDAVRSLGFFPEDDNHADALGIMLYATQKGAKDGNLLV